MARKACSHQIYRVRIDCACLPVPEAGPLAICERLVAIEQVARPLLVVVQNPALWDPLDLRKPQAIHAHAHGLRNEMSH